MKQRTLLIAAACLVAALASNSPADTFTDTVGDLNDGTVGDDLSGHTHLDITSVEVTNSFTDLIFKINLDGDPVAVDWGKYCIGFSMSPQTGDTSEFGNGWGRHITMGQGMDYWVGSWVDAGNGIQLWSWDGAFWNQTGGGSVAKDSSSVTLRIAFADIGKTFGDSVDFEVYTTGGGGADPAIDALTDPNVTVTTWAEGYSNNLASTYVLQTVGASTNMVTFTCDMGVPIWEFDTGAATGFDTNTDTLFVRGSFNNWSSAPGFNLIQVGPTLFSNTVEVVATIGDPVAYKFFGDPFPEWESPVLLGGADRTLTITGLEVTAPEVCFSDRCLTDPPVSTVNFEVDMTFQEMFGEFDPNSGDQVALPGSFNGWNTTALVLIPGADPDTNIYSGEVNFNFFPVGVQNAGFYKFKINSPAGAPRDGGWERPISTGSGNRAFGLDSTNQTLTFYFNDEDGIFPIDQVQRLDPDSVQLTFGAYAEAIYEIHARSPITGSWSTIGSITNSAKDYQNVSFTHTGLTGVDEQYYRAEFIGFNKPPLP